MTTIEIDTERGWEDVEQQVRELETHDLITICEMFQQNPTVYQMVSDELTFRAE